MAIIRQELADLREDYVKGSFDYENALADPIQQFSAWLDEALRAEVMEPTAMVLSTIDERQMPQSRVVLLKDIKSTGFSFYTNYHSAKGQQVAQYPAVSLLFFWPELQRQVRIVGHIERLPESESDQYFQSRPRGSQIGATASPQSQVIPDRSFLEERVAEIGAEYAGDLTIPRPAHWGGYLVRPVEMEFWQGRASRLHDRIAYVTENQAWKMQRLAP
ncbi:pyridoxamine 5'-phosphate oxidase [Sphingobacterium corticibacter]|uniref:Pyridoxine/pyridoxamine 5'-phosphate oxidase n=1 Tax=Sphingobacterium corticibacter TaxID=2171749 RepID=A0A2T8HIT3_9SPHI|nr:pyridoxamine 5'-phosphate oxidase [Sphingobacterium corticibacter]PVH25354.1 pyridoxamine 5'-phosphate oxidase [Sphingobacterium corticibacter]